MALSDTGCEKDKNGHRPSCMSQARLIESCCIVEKGIVQLEGLLPQQICIISYKPLFQLAEKQYGLNK